MSPSDFHSPSDAAEAARFAALRRKMVEYQLVHRGLREPRVLAAMLAVPREEFVPPEERQLAYDDGALPIGFDQTISQPYTVAFMCEAAMLFASDRVLEIGAGSGYAAAVLSHLAARIDTIERIPELADVARGNLERVGCRNVEVHTGDGTLGLPERAPFDAILVTAGATGLPDAYIAQLADGGRIVIPIGAARHSQTMYRFTRHGDRLDSEALGGFAFVPLVGEGATRPIEPSY